MIEINPCDSQSHSDQWNQRTRPKPRDTQYGGSSVWQEEDENSALLWIGLIQGCVHNQR